MKLAVCSKETQHWWGWRLKREIWAMGGFAGFILLSRGMSHLCAWPFWEGIGQMVWDV